MPRHGGCVGEHHAYQEDGAHAKIQCVKVWHGLQQQAMFLRWARHGWLWVWHAMHAHPCQSVDTNGLESVFLRIAYTAWHHFALCKDPQAISVSMLWPTMMWWLGGLLTMLIAWCVLHAHCTSLGHLCHAYMSFVTWWCQDQQNQARHSEERGGWRGEPYQKCHTQRRWVLCHLLVYQLHPQVSMFLGTVVASLTQASCLWNLHFVGLTPWPSLFGNFSNTDQVFLGLSHFFWITTAKILALLFSRTV